MCAPVGPGIDGRATWCHGARKDILQVCESTLVKNIGNVVGLAGSVERPPAAWVTFARTQLEPPSVLFVDVALKECLDVFAAWSVARLELTLKEPDAEGMIVPDEVLDLQFVEGDLMAGVESYGAIEAGQVTGGGKRAIYCFVPPEKSLEALGEKLLPVITDGGYQGTVAELSESPADLFHSLLEPDARELRQIGDLSLIQQLARAGDNPEEAREVSHWCYFESQATADAFSQWSVKAGFHGQEVLEDEASDLPVCVKVSHHGTMVFCRHKRAYLVAGRKMQPVRW